jgi:hypothetical protein
MNTLTRQSLEDYKNYIHSITAEYQNKKVDYDWNFTTYQENLDGNHYYYITNRFQTTKLFYIPSAKIMTITTIHSKDLEIMNKLHQSL